MFQYFPSFFRSAKENAATKSLNKNKRQSLEKSVEFDEVCKRVELISINKCDLLLKFFFWPDIRIDFINKRFNTF